MQSAFFVSLLIALLNPLPGWARPQTPEVTQETSTAPAATLTWKAVLLTGDDQLAVFDNARKTLKNMLLRMGVTPGDIRELSASRAERQRGIIASSADNLEGALRDLSVGDNDGCLVHMTSHGTRQGFYLRYSSVITPQRLDAILERTCGARPTVVLISACYSGVFLNSAMLRPNRIILTAAAADRTSFGCSAENEYTYWDGCLIAGFTRSDNWQTLYDATRQCVETKETQGRFRQSLPQAYFGEAIAAMRTPSAPAVSIGATVSRCPVANDYSYGFIPSNAVKVGLDGATGPARQLQYLNALRGPDGQALRFRQVGTSSTVDGILDVYELTYDGIEKPVRVFLDSYHFESPVAPVGFGCGIDIGLQ